MSCRASACNGDCVVQLRRQFYLWRLLGTGLAFAELGIGGVVLALTVIPLVTLFVRDEQARNRRAQAIIRGAFRLYVGLLRLFGILKLELVGAERLSSCRGCLVIANHPTLLDIVLIMALVPDAQCVVKHQAWRNPFLRPVVGAAGYIRNDMAPEAFVERCRDTLAGGSNLIIFPEGTRSVPGKQLRFQRGFAHVATLTSATLQPLTITCNPMTLIKGEPWYKIPERAPCFRIEVSEQIDTRQFLGVRSRALGARDLVSHLESLYTRKLENA
jgi:1-acyl-sn-glycerol-3-phosphate acyltransferase